MDIGLDIPQADSAPETAPAALRQKKIKSAIWQLSFAIAVATAMWWLVLCLIGSPAHWLHSLFVPSLIVLVIGLCILRNEHYWSRPARKLAELLPGLRNGEIPVEDLSGIEGGMKQLVPHLQQFARDLRQQKSALMKLDAEIRERVAGRTNALERQLGTLREQASRDGMTGLYNRRMFDAYLPKALERCTANKINMSVMAIDVDHFKLLNDTLGHAAGDDFLRNIGQIIRSGLREEETSFRIGGDEFVILMPGADPNHAQGLARRLIELVDACAKPLNVAMQPRLSIGIASLNEMTTAEPHKLLQLADQRLYEAKASRRRPTFTRSRTPKKSS